jgi:hypothetical protein
VFSVWSALALARPSIVILHFELGSDTDLSYELYWYLFHVNASSISKKPSSGMWCRMALVRTDVSEERIASIIKVKRISDLGTALAVPSTWSTLQSKIRIRNALQFLGTANVLSSLIIFGLMMEVIGSSETSVHTRVKLHHIPEDDMLHSHRRESPKSYISSHSFIILNFY